MERELEQQAEEARAEEARRAAPESHAAEAKAVAEHDEARGVRPDIEKDIQGFIEKEGLTGKALFVVSEFTPMSGVEMEIEEAGRLEFSTLPEALRAFEKDQVGQMSRASIEIEGQAVACKFADGCMNQAGDYEQRGETWRWKRGGGEREAFNVPTEFMLARHNEHGGQGQEAAAPEIDAAKGGGEQEAWEAERRAYYLRVAAIDEMTLEQLTANSDFSEAQGAEFIRDGRFPHIRTEKNEAAIKWAMTTENESAKEEMNRFCELSAQDGQPCHVVEGYKDCALVYDNGAMGYGAKTIGELVEGIPEARKERQEAKEHEGAQAEQQETRAGGAGPLDEAIDAGKAMTHRVLEGATVLADKALELVSGILDFFAPETPRKITRAEYLASAQARQEYQQQKAAEAKAERAIENIIEDRNTGRRLEVADFRSLSREQLETIKALGLDDGLKLLADEKLKTHQHERER